jgi:hypothetical protein
MERMKQKLDKSRRKNRKLMKKITENLVKKVYGKLRSRTKNEKVLLTQTRTKVSSEKVWRKFSSRNP